MFTIGDFAKLGRVSVRMLRHYDAIGLLRLAALDPASGYRLYSADQLRRLNRIVALKDLGFTLHQVQTILDDKVGVEELRGMLRLRRAQLEAQISADSTRLTRVEVRLRMIESEGHVDIEDVILKEIPVVRVAEMHATAASYEGEDVGPVIQPLFPELLRRLDAAGIPPTGPGVAYYEPTPEPGDAVVVHVAVPIAADPHPGQDIEVIDLPGIPSAATIIHRGSMEDADRSIQVLARWIDENGYRMVGYAREVSLECPPGDFDNWVTELQVTVVGNGA